MKIIQTNTFKTIESKSKKAPEDVCWEGYEMIGMKEKDGKEVPNCVPKKSSESESLIVEAKKTPAWQRSEGKSNAGGLNQKGRDSYNRETGGNLQAPVTESKPTGKRKKRRSSYCARSKGQQKMHNIDCKKTPDKPLCKARRRWKC